MTRRITAAKSGWGKGWLTQRTIEENVDEFDRVLLLDQKDEYRGLLPLGFRHFIAGPREQSMGSAEYRTLIDNNPRLIVTSHGLSPEEWRDAAGSAVAAARRLAQQRGEEILIVVEEAHFLAPQRGSLPAAIKGLATTGRGEGAASIWVTQRLAELEETVIAQADEYLLGGFTSDADLTKVGAGIEYPTPIHNPRVGKQDPESYPEGCLVDGEARPIRAFTDDNDSVCGSEWLFSDDAGRVERRDSREYSLQTEHYGGDAPEIADP